MSNDDVSVGQELLNTPFADFISKSALAVAEGQTKLDQNSMSVAKFLAETEVKLPNIDPNKKEEIKLSLLALGFQPTFYQFKETLIEIKMAITMAKSNEFKIGAEGKVNLGVFAASVNASYTSKYDFKVEGSSTLRTTLAPVPPPGPLQRYMEALIARRVQLVDDKIKEAAPKPPIPAGP